MRFGSRPKKEYFIIGVIALWALVVQTTNITFGLPNLFQFKGAVVDYWFNDEVKELEHIKSLLTPKAEMLHFNYPPLQYLLVSAVLLPGRLINGTPPEDWIISFVSRILSALAVVGSAVLLFLIGRRIEYAGGFAAALLLSVSPIAALLGKDVKPIALSGFLILVATYLALKETTGGSDRNRFVGIGASLGMSLMCSHLALAFFHLPIVAYFIGRAGIEGRPDGAQQKRSHLTRLARVLVAVALCLAVGGFILVNWERDLVHEIGKWLYSLNQHGRPFEYHLGLIDKYLDLARAGILVLSIALAVLLAYVWGRDRLIYVRKCYGLRFMEYAYGGAAAAVILVLGVATLLNPLVPVAVFRFVVSAREYMTMHAGYYGMHPIHTSLAGFPTIVGYALGVPFACLSVISAIYLSIFYKGRGRIYPFIVILAPFLLQLLTWNGTFRASRFSYSATLFMVLLSGLFVGHLLTGSRRLVRMTGLVLLAVVFCFDTGYTISYLRTLSYRNDPRVNAAEWIEANVRKGSSIAVKGTCDLPRNLGPIENLQGYRHKFFGENSDYCVMDGFEYFVMRQYASRTDQGYRYTGKDWWPSETGVTRAEAAAYVDIVMEKKYKLVGTFGYKKTRTMGVQNDLRLLLDPAEYYHKEVYVFRRKGQE